MKQKRDPFRGAMMMYRPAGATYAFIATPGKGCQPVALRCRAPELLMLNPDLNLPPATVHMRAFGEESKHLFFALVESGELEHLRPRQFELLVAAVLYQAGWEPYVTPSTRDGGRDVIAVRVTNSGPVILVAEAKKTALVGPGAIQRLESVRRRDGAMRALVVTTGTFSEQAKAEVRDHWRRTVGLVDGRKLVRWARGMATLAKKRIAAEGVPEFCGTEAFPM